MPKGTIYSTTSLMKAKEKVKLPVLFLWNMLISKEKAHRAVELEIHSKVGNRTIVPLVGRRENGTFIKREAFQKRTYAPKMLKPYKMIDIDLLTQQQYGETIYGDPMRNLVKIMMEDVEELKTIAIRTKQYLLSQLLTTGVLPANEGDEAIDFGEFKKVILSGHSLWTDLKSSPINFLKEQRKKIQKEMGVVPDTLILSAEVGAAFQENPEIRELLKLNQGVMISMAPREVQEGVAYLGYIPEINTTVYTFTDFVDDLKGITTELIPSNGGIYIKKKSFVCDYALITARLKQGQDAQTFVVDELIRKVEKDDIDKVELLSSPFIRPETPGSWVYFEAI
ncbi:major capsid protein [Cetobacterium sp. 2A]|uniref:major capsid protein n=1 Tax=Cetobacterium sp. 2A TaxID=2754723 RepID=UPI00163B7CF3|nr:major capsid protein [Cetobacterium sp. 2A]MBC2855368.1 major capsid protein [Cetobacterium sp. 2A]